METLIGAVFDTDYGLMILCIMLIIGLVINYFSNKPKT